MKVIYDREKDRGSFRVIRGGSWFGPSQHCLAALRGTGDPGDRHLNLGFLPIIRIKENQDERP